MKQLLLVFIAIILTVILLFAFWGNAMAQEFEYLLLGIGCSGINGDLYTDLNQEQMYLVDQGASPTGEDTHAGPVRCQKFVGDTANKGYCAILMYRDVTVSYDGEAGGAFPWPMDLMGLTTRHMWYMYLVPYVEADHMQADIHDVSDSYDWLRSCIVGLSGANTTFVIQKR